MLSLQPNRVTFAPKERKKGGSAKGREREQKMFRRFFSSSRNGRIGSKGGKGKGGTNRSATNGDAKETSADSKAAPSHTSVVQGFSELFQKDTRQR